MFKNGEGHGNVQCVLSPKEIIRIAREAGWKVEKEKIITPGIELQDGRWEVGNVCSDSWIGEVDKALEKLGRNTKRERSWVVAARDAVINARQVLVDAQGEHWEGKALDLVATMDVWCAVFVRV